ncbi:MAG: AAA family ATPase [Candidatus Micrarchaeaceae archaeon]
MIKSIELVNWKTHKHTIMSFQKGVNVLIGVMGAGKSSVIDGISFGLFGTFPMLNHRRTTIGNLISDRPEIADSAEVKIKFNVGDDDYAITRMISRKDGTTAKLEKNGRYMQTQSERVNEEIENLIKIDYDVFSRAVYAEQNRIDYFLELSKGERKKQIDQMLGLDNFAKAEENATSLVNSIRGIITEDSQLLAQSDPKGMKAQLDALTSERRGIEKEQQELSGKVAEKESRLKVLQKDVETMKSRFERSKRLEKEIAELSSKIETLKAESRKIDDMKLDRKAIESELSEKSTKLSELESDIRKLRKEESETIKIASEADAAVKASMEKSKERKRLLSIVNGRDAQSMEKDARKAEESLQQSRKEWSSLKGRKEDTMKWARELEEHISKCPVCEKDLDENTRLMLLSQKNGMIKKMDGEIGALEETVRKTEKSMAQAKKELEDVRFASTMIESFKDVDLIIKENSEKAAEYQRRHDSLIKLIETASSEMELLHKQLGEMAVKSDALRRNEKYESEIKECSDALEKSKKETSKERFNEKDLYGLHELVTEESASLSDMSSKMKGNERYAKSLDAQISDKVKAMANLNSIEERIERRRSQASSLNKFRSALIDTETHLRNSLVQSINSLMQEIWSELYPYADYSAIRLDARKDDYSLEACTGMDGSGSRRWIEIDGIASGGERSVACLTMRIALAMVIVPNLRWLILDEPTHNIDENGIGKFIEVLGSTLPKVVEQIFIITHDSALKNIASARVYSLERNKDKNEYTSVGEL